MSGDPPDIDEQTRARWAAEGRRMRVAQGLPPRITDPVAIARIAAIVWPDAERATHDDLGTRGRGRRLKEGTRAITHGHQRPR